MIGKIFIGLIAAFAVWKIIEGIIDFWRGIRKGNDWSELKKEIFEILKSLGKSELIGFDNDTIIEEIDIAWSDFEENREKLLHLSISAYLIDRTFNWKCENNKLTYKISL